MQVNLREFDLGSVRIVSVRLDGECDDSVVEQTRRDFQRMLVDCQKTNFRVVSIVDLSEMGNLNPKQRKLQSEFNKETEPLTQEVVLGMGFVAPNAVKRGMLTAIFWVAPPVVPYVICPNMPEALTWAFGICQEHGIKLSDEVLMDGRRRFA